MIGNAGILPVCGCIGDNMAVIDKEIDITRNIKIIEWLKSELLTDVANLFRVMFNGVRDEAHDAIADVLSNIILICYLLGRRLGLNYSAIESKLESKIKLGLIDNNDVEKYYGDLSELSRHFGSSRAKK